MVLNTFDIYLHVGGIIKSYVSDGPHQLYIIMMIACTVPCWIMRASSWLSVRCWVHRVPPRRTSVKRTALDLMQGQRLVSNLRQTGLASLWPMDPQLGEQLHLCDCVLLLYCLCAWHCYLKQLYLFSVFILFSKRHLYLKRLNGRKSNEGWGGCLDY